jgi:hypothetical protein
MTSARSNLGKPPARRASPNPLPTVLYGSALGGNHFLGSSLRLCVGVYPVTGVKSTPDLPDFPAPRYRIFSNGTFSIPYCRQSR